MKICKVCNEIVGSNQACSREGCPALANSDVGSLPALEAGFSGVADSAFQASLDHVGYVARNASRRIALFAVLTATALLIAAFIGYNLFVSTDSDEEITVEISGRANVRNAPTAEGSSVLETLSPGVELAGRWVDGASDPTERWFEFERNGENAYVWEGNLIVAGGFGNTQRVKKEEAERLAREAERSRREDAERLVRENEMRQNAESYLENYYAITGVKINYDGTERPKKSSTLTGCLDLIRKRYRPAEITVSSYYQNWTVPGPSPRFDYYLQHGYTAWFIEPFSGSIGYGKGLYCLTTKDGAVLGISEEVFNEINWPFYK